MKKVLVLYYSQSGQLEKSVMSMTAPLREAEDVTVDYCPIEPVTAYPYPWPFFTFLDVFPEAVNMDGCPVKPVEANGPYDLVILGYTPWFLSPSIPVTGFLKSEQAKALLAGKPVVTLIACRDMWIMAQEKMKTLLAQAGGVLVDNVVLTDQGKSLYTFITTPRWLMTGRKGAFWFFPPAGIAEEDIENASRFGTRLLQGLRADEEKRLEPMLKRMGAVHVNGKLIASEKIGTRSFTVWSRLMKLAGRPGAFARRIVIVFYALFLITMIATVVPLNLLIRKVVYPMRKEAIDREVQQYALPSGQG